MYGKSIFMIVVQVLLLALVLVALIKKWGTALLPYRASRQSGSPAT